MINGGVPQSQLPQRPATNAGGPADDVEAVYAEQLNYVPQPDVAPQPTFAPRPTYLPEEESTGAIQPKGSILSNAFGEIKRFVSEVLDRLQGATGRTRPETIVPDPAVPTPPPPAVTPSPLPTPTPAKASLPTHAPNPNLSGVQDLSSAGFWFKDFKDRASGTSIVSNTPGSVVTLDVTHGTGNTSPTFVVRDSKGNEVFRGSGVDVATARFIFTEDGNPPTFLDPKRARTFKALKVGEVYSITTAVSADQGPYTNSDRYRVAVRGHGLVT